MEKLTQGYEKFVKGKQIKENMKEQFESIIKKNVAKGTKKNK